MTMRASLCSSSASLRSLCSASSCFWYFRCAAGLPCKGSGFREIGIKNGGVAFDLTALYRKKAGLDERARIVIEQRHSIDFSLTVEELSGVLIDGEKGKRLKTLRLYALDLMGNLYQGRIGAVKKLLSASLTGKLPAPVPSSAPPAVQEGAAAQVSASAPEEERGSEDTTGDEEGIEE